MAKQEHDEVAWKAVTAEMFAFHAENGRFPSETATDPDEVALRARFVAERDKVPVEMCSDIDGDAIG